MANKTKELPVPPIKQIVPLKIKPTTEATSNRLYSNFVHVAATQYDFVLTFCDIPVPLGEAPANNEIEAAVQAQIVIPLGLVDSLVHAIGRAKAEREKDRDEKTK